MAMPWLFRKLFQNEGSGDKLNPNLLPAASAEEVAAGTDKQKPVTAATLKAEMDKLKADILEALQAATGVK